ncbi:Arm DNA-binding domain-containing protein [Pseudomonas aeruginosa]|uniref:Arm DNA-binding domain-containing protein n=1 Tax=Pseudomonas aeruginosa TaxID=287 RepID=UPI001F0820B7|nr:Arm DNA-binding domain-containing protein [Pseudomonas aeruginosa]
MVWRYRYRLNGKYEKLTFGKYPALTLKNARLMRDGASQMAAVGESPAQKKQRAKVAGPADTTSSSSPNATSRRSSSATARTTPCHGAIWIRTFFRTSA